MGFWSRIFGRGAAGGDDAGGEQRSWYEPWAEMFHGIGVDTAGVDVTPETALTASAVYAAVSVIGSAVATLPVHVVNRRTGEKLPTHPLNRILATPNEYMTWPDLMESYCLNLLATGNGYAWAQRDAYMNVVGLYPLKSLQTWPERLNGVLSYVSTAGASPSRLPAEAIVHTKNMSWDGLCGISPLRCGAGAVGLALALDRFARKFFENGANIGNVIELPSGMSPKALEEFKRLWSKEYEGVNNSHRTAAAPGLKVHKMGHNLRDSQATETRVHQLREVARIYQIPPHKLGDLERATFSNIEEQSRDFAENTLRRWIVKIEAAMERTLLREDERDQVKIRFNLGAIIRGSLKDQIEALTKGTGGAPIYTQNEARDYLGMQPKPGGDRLMSNLNQTAADARSEADPQRVALLRSIAGNLATKEANAVRRAAKKHAADPEAFEAWAVDFYRSHVETMARSLEGAGFAADELLEYCRQEGRSTATAFDLADPGRIEARILSIETEGADCLVERLMPGVKPAEEEENDDVADAA